LEIDSNERYIRDSGGVRGRIRRVLSDDGRHGRIWLVLLQFHPLWFLQDRPRVVSSSSASPHGLAISRTEYRDGAKYVFGQPEVDVDIPMGDLHLSKDIEIKSFRISGRILHSETGEGVEGVHVLVNNEHTGTAALPSHNSTLSLQQPATTRVYTSSKVSLTG